MAIDAEKVESKLNAIALIAEDLSAELYADSPVTAERFGKVATYCRRIATCVRLHGQVPLERPGGKIAKTVKSLVHIARDVRHIADNIPRNYEND